MLTPGTLLQSRYLIIRLIAHGGMGAVYEAKDQRLGSTVALKETFFSDDRLRKAFEREARLLARLRHPALPVVSDHFVEGDGQFLVMQFITGDDLSQMLEQRGSPFSPEEVLNWADQLIDALDYLHTQVPPIIHRDIKPQNLKLATRRQIILLDFGLAKGAAETTQMTAASSIFGYTPNYAPLEQMQGAGTDHRSDQYSLAATLYYLMTGLMPPDALTRASAVLNNQPDPLHSANEFNSLIKPAIAALLKQAMALSRDERFDSIALLRTALHASTLVYSDSRQESEEIVGSTALRSSPAKERPAQSESNYAATVIQSNESAGAESAKQTSLQIGKVSTSPTQTIAQYLMSEFIRHKQAAIIALVALVIAVSAIWLALYKRADSTNSPTMPLEKLRMAKLTTSGNASEPAISPDGKYVAYITTDAGGKSIWLRQIATSSNTQIIPTAKAAYTHLAFSQDGSYVYYVSFDNSGTGTLYQVPQLGGASRKLVVDVDSPITFSPDGKQFAFVRNYPKQSQNALIVVSANGSAEQKLATREAINYFNNPSWSPDGKTIACSVEGIEARNSFMNVVEVRVEGGAEKPIGPHKWSWVGQIAWLSDGSGLLATAEGRDSGTSQIWHLSYPTGEAQRITNDLNKYYGISLTANSNSLVTTQNNLIRHLWIVPEGNTARAEQIAPEAESFSWTPDGSRLVYESHLGGEWNIWVMNADGSNPKQLTVSAGSNYQPIVSRDGRYIVFGSNRTGDSHIWRMDIDGSNPLQLTNGSNEGMGDCSLDSQWIVYVATGALHKISINGGESIKLADHVQRNPRISPDGKLIVCDYWDKQPLTPAVTAIIPFEGGAPIKTFNIPSEHTPSPRWASDGRALLYSTTRGSVSNIWSHPLDGSAPKQLTDFKSDQIFWFDWSRDGKQLACSRGSVTSDIVLISQLK